MYSWSAKNPLYLQRGGKQKSELRGRGRGSYREYWMVYRKPGFLAVIWLYPHPLPPSPATISTDDTPEDCERETTCWRERGEGLREVPNHTTVKKLGHLHRNHAFITLWGSEFSCALDISTVNGGLDPILFLKVPKHEIFVTELILLSHPIWIGDLRTKAKNRFV